VSSADAYRELVERLAAAEIAAGREPLVPLAVPLMQERRLDRAGQRRLNEQRAQAQERERQAERAQAERERQRELEAQRERNREEERHARAMAQARRVQGARGGAPVNRPTLGGTNLFVSQARPGEVRVIDALIIMGVAAGSVLWTATRSSLGSELGWGTFWTLLGGFMYLEARPGSELQAAGASVTAANASYISLRLLHPNLAS
jgi:hypothetical protein